MFFFFFNLETRKEIRGYEGLYDVDIEGNVYSLIHDSSRRKRKLKPYVNTGGYLRVNLYDVEGRVKKHYIHRLVAQTFLPNPYNHPAVNHITANKKDNSIDNLEWCDAKYNIAESRRLGLQKDKNVLATSKTGECKYFNSIKEAAEALTGKSWAFQEFRKKFGDTFQFEEWRIEVMSNVVQSTRLSSSCD